MTTRRYQTKFSAGFPFGTFSYKGGGEETFKNVPVKGSISTKGAFKTQLAKALQVPEENLSFVIGKRSDEVEIGTEVEIDEQA